MTMVELERGRLRRCFGLAMLAVCLAGMIPAQKLDAQQAPSTKSEPVSFTAPAAVPAPSSPSSVAPPVASTPAAPRGTLDLRGLTEQLVALEREAQQLEQARAAIRHRGMRIGKYISWAAFGVLASQSLSFLSRAALTKEARQ